MTHFQPITTQVEFERRLKDRLARQCDRHREEFRHALDEHAAYTGRLHAALVDQHVRSVAAEMRFHNPEHAVKLADLDGIAVTDDGARISVDVATIHTRLTNLLAEEPGLAQHDPERTTR